MLTKMLTLILFTVVILCLRNSIGSYCESTWIDEVFIFLFLSLMCTRMGHKILKQVDWFIGKAIESE
jgi:hypothetical protein